MFLANRPNFIPTYMRLILLKKNYGTLTSRARCLNWITASCKSMEAAKLKTVLRKKENNERKKVINSYKNSLTNTPYWHLYIFLKYIPVWSDHTSIEPLAYSHDYTYMIEIFIWSVTMITCTHKCSLRFDIRIFISTLFNFVFEWSVKMMTENQVPVTRCAVWMQ